MGDDGLIGHQVSLDRKLGLLTSAQQGLTGVSSAINALAEQYPTLYSYASMQHFQQDIFDAEEHLQAARRLYNSNVSLYNQHISLPTFGKTSWHERGEVLHCGRKEKRL